VFFVQLPFRWGVNRKTVPQPVTRTVEAGSAVATVEGGTVKISRGIKEQRARRKGSVCPTFEGIEDLVLARRSNTGYDYQADCEEGD
jgi:hypothetical protein